MQLNILRRNYAQTTILMAGLVGLLLGIGLAKTGMSMPASLALLSVLAIPFVFRLQFVALVTVALLGFVIGSARGQFVYSKLQNYQPLLSTEVVLVGTIQDDPTYSDRGQTEFYAYKLETSEDSLPGKIRVRTFNGAGLRRGDQVQIEGKLYKGFGSRQGATSYATVTVLERQASPLENARQKFFAATNSLISDPESSLGLGFLVGVRTLLPDDLEDQLSTTGLTHIVAVSGYNLTVLVHVTRRAFAKRSRYLALLTSASLIAGFLMVTGLSASISRASIISGFALLAWFYGRNIRPMMLLLLGGAITAYAQPLFIWFDLGWWLSFLAFYGVLILAPMIKRRFFKDKLGFVGEVILETTSAQIMTMPLIMYIFNQFSAVAILANVLIIPLIPLAMLLTFLAGMVGMFSLSLGSWLALPAQILLTYMTNLISWLARIPNALIEVNISPQQIMAMVMILVVFMVSARRAYLDRKTEETALI